MLASTISLGAAILPGGCIGAHRFCQVTLPARKRRRKR